MFYEKDHDLHFQSDHSNHSQQKSPIQNDSNLLIPGKSIEKKDISDNFKGKNFGGLGLKSLISSKKNSFTQSDLNKDVNHLNEKSEKKVNDLDKLFMPNYQSEKKDPPVKQLKRKKNPSKTQVNTIEKKKKIEENENQL